MMDNFRSERSNEDNPQEFRTSKQNGNSAPTEFEGMNYEQQRGNYRNNESENHSKKLVGRNNAKKRRGEM